MSSDDASEARRMATLTGLATSRGFAAGPVFLHTTGGGELAVAEREIAVAYVPVYSYTWKVNPKGRDGKPQVTKSNSMGRIICSTVYTITRR